MTTDSSPSSSIDLGSLDVLLDSFAQAAGDVSTERETFYRSLTQKITAATESDAASILVRGSNNQTRVVAQTHWETLPASVTAAAQKFTDRVFDAVATAGHTPALHQKVSNRIVIGSGCVGPAGLQFAFLLLRDGSDNELAEQIFGDLATEIASQIQAFEVLKSGGRQKQSVQQLTRVAQLMQNLGKSASVSELSTHLVNDLAQAVSADRVWWLRPGGKILSVSGASEISVRTDVARHISKIARSVARSRGAVEWSDGKIEADGRRLPRALSTWIDELPSPWGYAIPVGSAKRPCGVLVLENLTSPEGDRIEQRQRVNETVSFAAPVVERSMRLYDNPVVGPLSAIFDTVLTRPVRSLVSLLLACGAIVGVAFLLFWCQRPFSIAATGALQPSRQQHVFASIAGEVDELNVAEGDHVAADETLLIVTNETLEKELITIQGEMAEAQQQLSNLKLSQYRSDAGAEQETDETVTASEIERTKTRLATLQKRLDFFTDQQSDLKIDAPIAGQITTPQLVQRLTARPIERGDLLMTVADMKGPWEIEVRIPDNRVDFIRAAQERQSPEPIVVDFRLASDSGTTRQGTLSRIDYRSELDPETNQPIVRGWIEIDESELGDALLLGTRTSTRIQCGQRSNYFLLTYELKNRIREWMFY